MLAPTLGKPTPLHVLIEQERRSALPPVEPERPPLPTFVTELPKPYLAEPPTNAVRLLDAARAVGMVAQLFPVFDGHVVEGYDREAGIGFRAMWRRGKAHTATWHERERRWGMMHDERPAHDARVERRVKGKLTTVPHPNRMPSGLSRDHLVMLSGPQGVEVGVTEVSARIKALAALESRP